jgi:hypothetical protein
MFEEFLELNIDFERKWISHDLLIVGDYGGAGTVGMANINFLKNHAKKSINMDSWKACFHEKKFSICGQEVDLDGVDLIIVEAGWNSQQAYVLVGSELEEYITELDQYPAIDDESVSEVEQLWRDEHMDYLLEDVWKRLWSRYENFDHWWNEPCPALIPENIGKPSPTPYECFNDLFEQVVRDASQEGENWNCWQYEYNSAYFYDPKNEGIDRIVDAFMNRLRGIFAEEGRPAHNRKLARERQLKLI